jgi:iron complex transport system ATP-binding protein
MLDPAHAAAVAAAVKSIAARGRAVLFSTHDFGFAAAVADRVMILANGRMLAMETPENALTLNNLEQAFGIRFRVAPLPSPG